MNIRSLMVLLAMLVVYSCDDDTKSDITSQNRDVNISFAAQTDVFVKANTKAAVPNLTTASKFTFYAFKKGTNGNYSFAKKISDASSTYENSIWKSKNALLSVGTYRFICFYNLPDGNISSENALNALGSKPWEEIKNDIIIEHSSSTDDMDEFFCGESNSEIQINENEAIVEIKNTLKRVVSRIDVKFVKITEDGKNEVTYSDGKTIFGADDNLQSITLDIIGAAKKFSLGTATPPSDIWADPLKFSYNTDLVVYGKSSSNSTFPTANSDPTAGNNFDDVKAMEEGIIKGSAYFRGAYILPFMDNEVQNKKLSKISISLSGKEGAERIILAEDLKVQKNYITLVTVKLKSSTTTGPGNDDEHLFNPKVKFTVTIDKLFAGVNNSDVVVD